MIKIEFPADRRDIAENIGRALLAIGTGQTERTVAQVNYSPDPIDIGDEKLAEHNADRKLVVAGVPADTMVDGKEIVDASTAAGIAAALCDVPEADEKGVPFDAKFCARAKEPFYMSGNMKGQWKKGRGVDQSAYDAWYREALMDAKLGGPAAEQTPTHTVVKESYPGQAAVELLSEPAAHGQAAKAFSPAAEQAAKTMVQEFPASTMFAPAPEDTPAAQNPAAAFSPAPAAPPADAPTNAGTLMAWVSAKQAAKVLTQDDINQAYQAAGVQIADLFGADAAQACGAVYSILVQKAGA